MVRLHKITTACNEIYGRTSDINNKKGVVDMFRYKHIKMAKFISYSIFNQSKKGNG